MSGQDPHDEWAMLACSGPHGLSFQSQAKASSTTSALWLAPILRLHTEPTQRALTWVVF